MSDLRYENVLVLLDSSPPSRLLVWIRYPRLGKDDVCIYAINTHLPINASYPPSLNFGIIFYAKVISCNGLMMMVKVGNGNGVRVDP
ncbi:hypothetical protein Tco_1546484 [Tanacetum coccineum]